MLICRVEAMAATGLLCKDSTHMAGQARTRGGLLLRRRLSPSCAVRIRKSTVSHGELSRALGMESQAEQTCCGSCRGEQRGHSETLLFCSALSLFVPASSRRFLRTCQCPRWAGAWGR